MVKGHLDQTRCNQRSTKTETKPPNKTTQSEPTASPTYKPTTDNHHDCYLALHEPTGQIFTDQTGKFITPSSTGNNYLILLYDYDSNAILAEPIPNRQAKAILKGYQTLHTRLVNAGIRPRMQRLDNECSSIMKEFMTQQGIDFQLVNPGDHRRNAVERGMRTFKNHLIGGLASVDKDFPFHLWDRLIPQADITLNLLRGSRLDPTISASLVTSYSLFVFLCTYM